MIKPVKILAFITILTCFFSNSNAQLRLPGINNGLASDIKKVIEDYPNRFINIMGEVIAQHTQSTDYRCNVLINGAEDVVVTRYPAKKDICSWQAVMLTTEEFSKAKNKFRAIFQQLNNLSVTIPGIGNCKLKGEYIAPTEEKRFTSVLFSLEPSAESTRKLKIEISIQAYEPMEWKVKVLIYDREREDAERGNAIEN